MRKNTIKVSYYNYFKNYKPIKNGCSTIKIVEGPNQNIYKWQKVINI